MQWNMHFLDSGNACGYLSGSVQEDNSNHYIFPLSHCCIYRGGLWPLENHISFTIDFLISTQLHSKGRKRGVIETSISIIHVMESYVTLYLCRQFHEGGWQRFNTFLSRHDWHYSGQCKRTAKVNQSKETKTCQMEKDQEEQCEGPEVWNNLWGKMVSIWAVMRRKQATALNYQRDPVQTCKTLCKSKVHGAREGLVWGDGETPITIDLKNTLDKHLSGRADVLLTLSSRSYGLFPDCLIRFLYSTSLLNANTHILI